MAAESSTLLDLVRERRWPLALLGFTGLSLFAHLATFFVFQVVYPQRVTLPPPAPQVALLTPGTPERDALLRWVAAEDPALVAASAGAEPPGLLEFAYRPSYSSLRTPPRTLPAETERPVPPPSPIDLGPGSSLASLTPAPPKDALPALLAKPIPTRLHFSAGLAERSLAGDSHAALPFRSTTSLQPARFLAALDDRGQIQFLYLQESSSLPAADRAAAAFLLAQRFSPGETPLAWGFITIFWGDENYAAPVAASTAKLPTTVHAGSTAPAP